MAIPEIAGPHPDPEIPAKAQRRHFTAEYKRHIVELANAATEPGAIGALLRSEGLYSSHLVEWRRQYREGALAKLKRKKRGRKAEPNAAERKRIEELERENARLRRKLEQAERVIEIQKKVSDLMEIDLETDEDTELD